MSDKPLPLSAAQLESVCKALAHTATGLTGTEIGHALKQVGVKDIDPAATKWKRLYNALAARQNADRSGDRVLAFIAHALDPARYTSELAKFEHRRHGLNVALAFYGLEFSPDGRFRKCSPAATLPEAHQRASHLRAALQQRGVDEAVLVYCRAELLQDNYFHAVLEATKSIASYIRQRTGLVTDGADLVKDALLGADPPLLLNAFVTDTEKGEQRGFANLLIGLFGTFRNPTAHAPRAEWPMPEEDALDLMSLASYAHRRLRAARKR